ncbi:alcohol dehydrogenase catalytic domain-containing protein [Caldimonas sp. KR1-144]|uniref:alcohol dehydrogenase catalytic domain-containing protein n=1 Tax=Caldimonas sp. KR1-144 TaxID=3400911 RepID=UPI003C0A4A1C
MRRELVCVEPGTPPRLAVRDAPEPRPAAGEVLVRVQAASVNPIDVKRAAGYGRRMFSLKGAARAPFVLGNDLAGVVEAVGARATRFSPGQKVFGLVGARRAGGTHASLVAVPQDLLRPAPGETDPAALAVLPYSFTTLWLALRAIGLGETRARGARVLIHGATGGLGRLAMQLLVGWGCRITAICGRGQRAVAEALDVQLAVERWPGCLDVLRPDYDAVLNFGSWDDDAALASRLAPGALGHATTVHPLLGNFDRLGWLRGAAASRREWKAVRAVVASRAPQARYAWTVFRPDREALDALADGVRARRLALPVGIARPLDQADAAFAHVSAGLAGKAVLLP